MHLVNFIAISIVSLFMIKINISLNNWLPTSFSFLLFFKPASLHEVGKKKSITDNWNKVEWKKKKMNLLDEIV